MKKLIKIIIAAVAVCTVATGCKKFVDVGQPKNQLVSAEVFADSTDASASLLGIYIACMNSSIGLNSGGLTLYPGLSSDELAPTGSNPSIIQFYADNVLTNNNLNNGLWVAGYNYIYATNACLEGLTNSAGITNSAKIRISAEARFIRGYEYFCLLNLYGGVPDVTSTNYKVTGLLPRATIDQVYNQITGDLEFAELNLGINNGANDRPNSLAASALLARVFLCQGKYDQAAAEATKVINSGNFELEADLNKVFLSGSAETIWQLDLPFNKYTWEGQTFVPSSSHAEPKYVLTADLYNSFEPGDLRVTSWTKTNKVGSKSYNYPYKYKNNVLATTASEGYVLLRLSEQYLIRAEAELKLGDLNSAANDINQVRNRAGLSNTEANTNDDIFSAIQAERRHEFFCEGGSRWFDLKRWNVTTPVLGPSKTSWNINDQLYPIPVTQISSNPNLIQNPGY
ncbi:MAG: RagB/SusD family nutrient uptake outer membrane protein [Mucilaginibacter sp.]